MKIQRLIGGTLESNGYILYRQEGGEAYIVDPGYQPERYIKALAGKNLTLKGILLTHHHYDHVGGVKKIRDRLGCPVMIHRKESPYYKGPADRFLEDGEKIFLEDEEILVIHTPGHTAGGVCFYSEKSRLAFTGDTIFNVDLGRVDLPGGSLDDLRNTVRTILDRWENDITIYPGHGDSCNMKFVRGHNTEFLELL